MLPTISQKLFYMTTGYTITQICDNADFLFDS